MQERLNKNSAITLVELAPTAFGKLEGPLMGDTYNGINLPTRAVELLKEVLHGEKWTNVVAINPRYNETPALLSDEDWKRIIASPVLGISYITRTAPQSEELARRYKAAKPDGIVIAGGTHATFCIEETLKWADYVGRFEGDKTLPALLEALENNGNGREVQGVSYMDTVVIVNEPDRPYLTEEELGKLPWPQFDPRFRKRRVYASTIIAARGCPKKCDFCIVTRHNGLRQRRMGNQFVLPRIEELYKGQPNDRLFFADDNFAGKPLLAEQLLEEMIDRNLTDLRYMVQLHPEIGKYRERLPGLLKKAGIFLAAFGIESVNQEALIELGKDSRSVADIIEGIAAFREAGVPILGMFINGVGDDNEDRLNEQLEWAKENVDIAQFFVPSPLPGTPFAQKMEEEGRVLTRNHYLFDGQHVILRPKNISPYNLQMKIREMNEKFFTYKLSKDNFGNFDPELDKIIRLYAMNVLRNARYVHNSPQMQAHIQDLKIWG